MGSASIACISVSRQTVVLGPNLIGWGKRPSLTPAHHEDADIGMIPGEAFEPTICLNLKNFVIDRPPLNFVVDDTLGLCSSERIGETVTGDMAEGELDIIPSY